MLGMVGAKIIILRDWKDTAPPGVCGMGRFKGRLMCKGRANCVIANVIT